MLYGRGVAYFRKIPLYYGSSAIKRLFSRHFSVVAMKVFDFLVTKKSINPKNSIGGNRQWKFCVISFHDVPKLYIYLSNFSSYSLNYAEACDELGSPFPRHCTYGKKSSFQRNIGAVTSSWQHLGRVRDLNFRSSVSDTNELPLDQPATHLIQLLRIMGVRQISVKPTEIWDWSKKAGDANVRVVTEYTSSTWGARIAWEKTFS